MFISLKRVSGECVCVNVFHILWIMKSKKSNAVVYTVDGDSFVLAESYEEFCERLEQSSIKPLCPLK